MVIDVSGIAEQTMEDSRARCQSRRRSIGDPRVRPFDEVVAGARDGLTNRWMRFGKNVGFEYPCDGWLSGITFRLSGPELDVIERMRSRPVTPAPVLPLVIRRFKQYAVKAGSVRNRISLGLPKSHQLSVRFAPASFLRATR